MDALTREPGRFTVHSHATEYITIQQAAEALGCSQKFIRRAIDIGTLPSYRFTGSRLIRIKSQELHHAMKPDNAAVVAITARCKNGGEI
ncbi:excisionase family DNA-binding protein [Pseudoglutamicibacter cumminsii]|uniref:excisionase family DNA-binding protein n=1 Tax=Pseudoglutamicibacter cumminsii TaxID=156979 RepID=UPI0037C69FD9